MLQASTMSSDKRVVLFGKTGDGKSTVANVLVTGGIEIPMMFPASDAPTGCTSQIRRATGRGWSVTDTIGLGEAASGTRSNAEAKNDLTDFLKNMRDEYSHIIFVQRATNKLTQLDEMIFLLFTSIFEGAEEAFVILFTEADEEWLAANRASLPDYMNNYEKFVVDIPPVADSDEPVREEINKVTREMSLQKLEENLNRHFERRGSRLSVPRIARMNDAQLPEKSSSLMQIVINFIHACLDPEAWKTLAYNISSVIDVVREVTYISRKVGVAQNVQNVQDAQDAQNLQNVQDAQYEQDAQDAQDTMAA